MELTYVTCLSVLFQAIAVVFALRLIRVSGSRWAWVMISMAILGMAVRRSITLFRLFSGDPPQPLDLMYETIGLFTSLSMLAGILFVAPIFESIRRKEEERETMVRELREAFANVKTLSGLLPICASCKMIRDDKGYWNQIEAYIGTRTDAEFSHSICPDCRKKLYPNLNP
jgi:hypothetical protein